MLSDLLRLLRLLLRTLLLSALGLLDLLLLLSLGPERSLERSLDLGLLDCLRLRLSLDRRRERSLDLDRDLRRSLDLELDRLRSSLRRLWDRSLSLSSRSRWRSARDFSVFAPPASAPSSCSCSTHARQSVAHLFTLFFGLLCSRPKLFSLHFRPESPSRTRKFQPKTLTSQSRGERRHRLCSIPSQVNHSSF